MSQEVVSDGISERIERLLHERKVVFARWSFAKSRATYRGIEFSLLGGPNQDEIEVDGAVFGSLEELFGYLDTGIDDEDGGADEDEEGFDEAAFIEALGAAWDEWRKPEEAWKVHVGEYRLD